MRKRARFVPAHQFAEFIETQAHASGKAWSERHARRWYPRPSAILFLDPVPRLLWEICPSSPFVELQCFFLDRFADVTSPQRPERVRTVELQDTSISSVVNCVLDCFVHRHDCRLSPYRVLFWSHGLFDVRCLGPKQCGKGYLVSDESLVAHITASSAVPARMRLQNFASSSGKEIVVQAYIQMLVCPSCQVIAAILRGRRAVDLELVSRSSKAARVQCSYL